MDIKIRKRIAKKISGLIINDPLDVFTVNQLLQRPDITIDTIFNRRIGTRYEKTTFLHAAISENNIQLIDWLMMKRNIDMNIRVPNIGTPVELAIRLKRLEVVRKLQSYGGRLKFDDKKTTDDMLFQATMSGNTELVKYLIEKGARVNERTDDDESKSKYRSISLLQHYIRGSDFPMTKFLLYQGADVHYKSDNDYTPMIYAARQHNLGIIKILIKYGADINSVYEKDGDVLTLFHAALDSDNIHVVEFFYNREEVVKHINIVTEKKKKSALHYFFHYRRFNTKITTFLLNAGVDVNMEDCDGKLAIDYTARHSDDDKHHNIMKMHLVKLVSAGLPVCERNKLAIGDGLEDFAAECCQEVTIMKNTVIDEVNITFYDLLYMSIHKLAIRLKCYQNKLNEINNRVKLCEMFPLYGEMIFYKLPKIQKRILLLEDAEEQLIEIFNYLQLPYLFMKELLNYIDTYDLKKFIV